MAESLRFARSLYAPQAVEDAARAFANLCKAEVILHDDVVEISVSDPDPDVADVLMDEIANFALALTARGRR